MKSLSDLHGEAPHFFDRESTVFEQSLEAPDALGNEENAAPSVAFDRVLNRSSPRRLAKLHPLRRSTRTSSSSRITTLDP